MQGSTAVAQPAMQRSSIVTASSQHSSIVTASSQQHRHSIVTASSQHVPLGGCQHLLLSLVEPRQSITNGIIAGAFSLAVVEGH
jgi:hypothetical protein